MKHNHSNFFGSYFKKGNMKLKIDVSIQAIMLLSLVGISFLSISTPVSALPAENETPSSLNGILFLPFFYEAEVEYRLARDATWNALENQGYSVTVFEQEVAGMNPTGANLIHFNTSISSGDYGVICIFSHGAGPPSPGLAVEAYVKNSSGLAARDQNYTKYLEQGFKPEWIEKGWTELSYVISVTPLYISSHFKDAKTIVYVAACYSATFSDSLAKARDVLGYAAESNTTQQYKDAQMFWGNMDGTRNQGTKRPVKEAINECPKLSHIGAGNTVLAPIVKEHGGSPVVFDCKMDTSIAPDQVVTSADVALVYMNWVGDDTITFVIYPPPPPPYKITFIVHADKATSGNNGAKLDGDWVGPNGDDYVYTQEYYHRVGGIVTPIHKLGLLAPYIGLASTILVATVATTVYVKRIKRRKEKQ